MERFKHLLSPLVVAGKVYKNRITAAPAIHGVVAPNGLIRMRGLNSWEAKAAGGCACVCVGEVDVDHDYGNTSLFPPPTDFTLYEGPQFEGWRTHASTIKKHGALAMIELSHCGLKRFPGAGGNEGAIGPVTQTIDSPQGTQHVYGMDEEQMNITANNFATCALYMKKAGFDGVLIHGGHGWLLQQFLSPLTNTRTDEYGGSIENRSKFPVEVLRRVRQAVGDDFIVELRISGSQHLPGGLEIEDSARFAQLAEPYIDIIHVSGGVIDLGQETGMYSNNYNDHFCNMDAAWYIKQRVNIPVSTVGGINDPDLAERYIAEGKIDLIAMGRQLAYADAEFANKCIAGEPEEIDRCIRCGVCKIGDLPDPKAKSKTPVTHAGGDSKLVFTLDCDYAEYFEKEAGGPQKYCTVNPMYDRRDTPAEGWGKAAVSKRVLVVGGGIAGMQAAITAHDRGHTVTLIEKSDRLGGTLNFTDHDLYKADLRSHKDRLIMRVKKRDIPVLLNTVVSEELLKDIAPDIIIAAIGAFAVSPPIPGLDHASHVLDAYQWDLTGKKIVMIGGGLSGCETALTLARRGNEVVVIEQKEELAMDSTRLNRIGMLREMDKQSVTAYTGLSCTSVSPTQVTAKDAEGKEFSFSADRVAYALGMKPAAEAVDQIKVLAGDIPVISVGDCVQPQKAAQAAFDACTVALNI